MARSSPESDFEFKQPYKPLPASEPSSPPSDTHPIESPSAPKSLRDGTICAVAKFMWNAKPGRESNLISRTFGKVAIIDRVWTQTMAGHVKFPENDEFWLVDVCKDMSPGTNRGVLILRPRYALARTEPTRLFPGTFDEELVDGILYVRPKHPGPYWIASLSLKELLLQRYQQPTGLVVAIQPPTDALDRAAASLIVR